MSSPGLLVVNADDWGGFRQGTDAIDACFEAGAISSATAMVHMADSERAAVLGVEGRRPLGLHLNFTQPFDARVMPEPARSRQLRLCAHFANLSRRRWRLSPDPRLHRLVADGICDQMDEFHARYGQAPTHMDSHHHVHVCPDVFLSRALPRGTRVRQTLSPLPQVDWAASLRATPRWVKHHALASRFTTTSRFWLAREVVGGNGSVPLSTAVAWAAQRSVEIMVHPSFPREVEVLHSERWLELLSHAPLDSYGALRSRRDQVSGRGARKTAQQRRGD